MTSHTIECHSHLLFNAIQRAVGDVLIAELRKIDAVKVKAEARSVSSSGELRATIVFRRLLSFIVDCGEKLNFDWRDIEIPYGVSVRVVALEPDDIEIIRTELSSVEEGVYALKRRVFTNARTRAMFELSLHTGLRLSEVLSVQIKDLDFRKEKIDFTDIKSGLKYTRPIKGATKHIQDYLSLRDDDCPALFVTTSSSGRYGKEKGARPLEKESIKSNFYELKKRLKIRGLRKDFHFHMVRKSYVTQLLRKGVDIKSVQWLARHASERTTLKYYAAVNEEFAEEENNRVMENF